MKEVFEVLTADGHRLQAQAFGPADAAPSRIVVIAPAMGVRQSYYEPFACWLASQGLVVVTFDYRGMGDSAPASLKGFKADIHDWAQRDLPAVVEVAAQRHPGLPMSYVGHSLGGQIFGLLPNRHRFDRVLTVASGSGYAKLNAKPLRYYAWWLWHVVAPISIALSGYFPGKRLKKVGDLPAGVMLQWRRWCMHPDYVGSEGEAVRLQYAQIQTPITALIFPDDEYMTDRGIRRLHSLYAGAPVHFETVKPQALGLKRIGHFGFFRDKMQAALWPQVPQWLGASATAL